MATNLGRRIEHMKDDNNKQEESETLTLLPKESHN